MEPVKSNETHEPQRTDNMERYKNKEEFLELLRNNLMLEWAENLTAEDLILTDQSYFAPETSDTKFDLIYRVKVGGEEKVLFCLWKRGHISINVCRSGCCYI